MYNLHVNDGEVKTYIGLTEPPLKKRLYKHKADRRDRNLEKATAMSGGISGGRMMKGLGLPAPCGSYSSSVTATSQRESHATSASVKSF